MRFVCRTATIAVLLVVNLFALGQSQAAAPEWIWLSERPAANEVAHFRKTFSLPAEARSAVLAAAADDEIVVFVNDQQAIRRHASWQQAALAGVSDQLRKGENVIAVRGRNKSSTAGIILWLDVELNDGSKQTIVTDTTWKAIGGPQPGWQEIDFNDTSWRQPFSFGKLGVKPWGNVALDPSSRPQPQATPPDRIAMAPGFKVELLYSVPATQQGSWVRMTVDARGRLIVSDQDGALYRVSPGAHAGDTRVERLAVEIGQAHGLLYALDSLYVVVNGRVAQGSGLYRVRDTNGDDQFDEVKLLRRINGGGEHGPHCVVLGPDGKSLYVAGGNHTKIPDPETSRVPRNWQEDLLLPRMWDAGGHAVGVLAPGGWVCRTDADGRAWELVSGGYRNQYDVAFNQAGELFTYDSDMEWDIGMPWYRPTRVCHATSGSDFGWRSGSGNAPGYYADSLPATVDIGPGSPTGVVFGTGAKFPTKYQQALYLCDWSYGNIYAAHLTPQGSTYDGEFERFATAAPLPVTDIVINPQDGAMYFTIGGRRTQSGLYRVTYVGPESTQAVAAAPDAGSEARAVRHTLEAFHGQPDPHAVEVAWPYLAHPDGFLRYAARVAIEHQSLSTWRERALAERHPKGLIQSMIALARCGEKSDQPEIIAALGRLEWSKLKEEDRLGMLRAYALAFARFGQPPSGIREAVLNRLDGKFPAATPNLNRELSSLLIYLEAPRVTARCLQLMAKAGTQEEAIHYAFSLRSLRSGWTHEQRRAYFSWFNDTGKFRGGHSFSGFLANAKKEAIDTLDEQEKTALAAVLQSPTTATDPDQEVKARAVVREWTMGELAAGIDESLRRRNFQHGREMFAAAACFKCHRFAGEGGIIGPDLTGVGKRFDNRYLLESLIEPSKTISDQYQATIFLTRDGRTIVGKVANLGGDNLMVITNMLEPGDLTNINRFNIEEQQPSPVSMMPTGLLNTLNRDEILDLLAYLRSGGDPEHEVFR